MKGLDLPTGRPRVFVVDDDPTVLNVLVSLLQAEFDVSAALNGRDALRLVRRDPPDLVLLDVQLPDVDGFTLCRRLKADPLTADTPIAFLTAHGDEASELEGLSAGAEDFIAKPPRGAVVLARCRNLVRLKRQADLLRREARRDGLTGLANKRHFNDALANELLRARRQHKPVSVVLLDIDHFKAFNDHYGHLAGDGALTRVGQILTGLASRPGDLAGRLGGEEFALLLPDTTLQGAMALAQRVLSAFAGSGIAHQTSPTAPHLSCSLGVATQDPVGETALGHRETDVAPLDMDASTELLSRADAALYRAKHLGRNQAAADPASPPAQSHPA